MTGLHQRSTDVMEFEPKIRQILQKIIDRGIALEWNTGGMNPRFHYYNVQNEQVFSLYRSMGGSLVTLGSDAHSQAGIGNHFAEAKQALKHCGFEYYHHFKNKAPIAVEL